MMLAMLLATYAGWCRESTVSAWGPYPVGQQTIVLLDPQRGGRRLVTEIWYPRAEQASTDLQPGADAAKTLGSANRYRLPVHRRRGEGPAGEGRVVRNAPAAAERFPVILFSHGLTAVRDQSQFLTRFWASHGYVVAAPDHQGNTGYDFNPLEMYQSGLERPRDLRFLLGQLWELNRQGDWELAGRLNLNRVAATGHSLGGYTALVLGGAWIHVKGLPIRLDPGERPDFYEIADPHVVCVVALAPLYKPAFNAEGLAHLKLPTLILGGTCDTVTPFEEHQRPIFRELAGPATLAKIEGASHFSFADENLLDDAPFFIKAMHKPTIGRKECDDIIRTTTLRFLDENLKR